MTDIRHAFSEATAGFVDAVLAVPDDAWAAPGLGVWTLQELVGHASRAVVTVEQYLDAPKLEVTIHSPLDYYTRGLQLATPALHDDVAERGRQAGAALGDDPVSAIRPLAQRVVDRVAIEPDDAVCSSRFGGMRLIDYLPTRVVELTVHTLDITDALDYPPTVRANAVALTTEIMTKIADPLVLIRSLGGRAALPDGFNVFGVSDEPTATPIVGPLADLKVIDASSVVAGPACARYLADFGAEVIKVERPDGGDTLRNMGWRDPRDDVTLWWKLGGRGKRTIALDLKSLDDLDVMHRLCDEADVLIENFRPGTLERLGLGPDVLLARNPRLVITRITGFGQDGPYASRPGFATIAEAMSGFAAINGEPDGGPLLPPIALTDEVTGLVAAFATLVGVHSGVGQVVDVNLLESLFQLMGPLIGAHRLLGYEQPRMGSGIPYSVPRGTYQCADGKWVALSTSAESVASRVMALVGLGDDLRFATFAGRVEHRDEVDRVVRDWIAARPSTEVLVEFQRAEAAIAPVMTMGDIDADPHYLSRDAIVEVDGVPMQGLIAHLAKTPGRIRWAGRPLDADGDEIRSNGW